MPDTDTSPSTYEQIVEAAADLLQGASDWLRNEAETTVREKVVIPLQRLGSAFVVASTAMMVLLLGLTVLAAGFLVFLGESIGYVAALWIIGGVLLLIALITLATVVRGMRR